MTLIEKSLEDTILRRVGRKSLIGENSLNSNSMIIPLFYAAVAKGCDRIVDFLLSLLHTSDSIDVDDLYS